MEIVDRSLRESLRRLKAESSGGVTTRYSTKHVRIHKNPLMVSFVRMTGLDIPWAMVYGKPLDADGPRFKFIGDPRRPGALEDLIEDFADELLEYFGDANFSKQKLTKTTLKPEDMPQLWVSDSSNRGILQSLAFAFYQEPGQGLPNKKDSFGRLCTFLYEHSSITGHQLIVDATALLNNMYVLPADDYIAGHLASTLAWVQASEGVAKARIDAIRALDHMSSITIEPDVENGLHALFKGIRDDMEIPSSAMDVIRKTLRPELERRWDLLKSAWQTSESDGRLENTELETLVVDSLFAFRTYHQVLEIQDEENDESFPRPPETDDDPIPASFHYLKALEADDKFICYMVHDDRELLGDVFYDGTGFVGKVISVSDDVECVWEVAIDDKFGRLLKKREGETYCLIGDPQNASVAITGFSKRELDGGSGQQWVVEFTWSKTNGAAMQNSTLVAQAISKEWVDHTVVFVPSFAHDLHDKAQKVVLKASRRRGSWTLREGASDE